jgi:hypothetical protein
MRKSTKQSSRRHRTLPAFTYMRVRPSFSLNGVLQNKKILCNLSQTVIIWCRGIVGTDEVRPADIIGSEV